MQEKISPGRILARIVSILFHPVFVPTWVYAFLLCFSKDVFFGIPEKTQTWWLVIIAYITITFPLLIVFLLWRLKFIDSMHMRGLKERYGPLIASMLFYFWTFWTFHREFNAPMLLQSFLLGVFLTTVSLFMVTIFYKISLHTGAWGAVVMFSVICAFHQIQFSILFLIVSIVIAGLVGTARLFLKEHTSKEIYTAYIIGGLSQLLAYLVCKIML